MPRVIVDDSVPRARFDEALEGGALAGFPAEVEFPVRLPGKLTVPYPRTALEARREGSVLAWAIVNQQGVVWQRDLGDDTARLAAAIDSFDPDTAWTPIAPEG